MKQQENMDRHNDISQMDTVFLNQQKQRIGMLLLQFETQATFGDGVGWVN